MIKIGNKDINDFKIGETAVSKVAIGSQTVWEKTSGGNEPIKFSIESGTATVSMTKTGAPNEIYLQYSRDKLSWSDWDLTALEISELSPLYIKGNNQNGISSSGTVCYTFTVSGSGVSCSGNIMSLLGPEVTSIPTSYCFANLFKGSPIVSAPELPATELTPFGYYCMFSKCASLVSAPELPATTLQDNCYYSMFFECTALTSAPALPATILVSDCYSSMFSKCYALTTAPELTANTLATRCYSNMFKSCSALSNVKCTATSISATKATYNWLSGVAASGTFTKASGVDWTSGDSGIPEGWTVVEV